MICGAIPVLAGRRNHFDTSTPPHPEHGHPLMRYGDLDRFHKRPQLDGTQITALRPCRAELDRLAYPESRHPNGLGF
jgi:hypothetical protein